MNKVYNEFPGHAYDLLHPFMTEAQRKTVRQALSEGTRGEIFEIGMDGLRPSSDTSNWVPMHICQLMATTLAIEGEQGYNPELYWRVQAAYERFLQDGVLRDGTTFEGMGHNNGQELQMLVMSAKRGSLLFASETVRRHISHFYLAVTEPWGWGGLAEGTDGISPSKYEHAQGAFTWDETNGGVAGGPKHQDVHVYKYLFPDSPVVDFVFRTAVANYTGLDNIVNHAFGSKWGACTALYMALFASDADST